MSKPAHRPDTRLHIAVQEHPFSLQAVVEEMSSNPSVGAVASFVGVCRDVNEGAGVRAMVLEHYPGMTEKAIAAIVDEACERWALSAVTVVHRVGRLEPTDPIVLVAVASSHRGEAFAACEFIMDFLKTRAPFWKKESPGDADRWVAARDSDANAAGRWDG